MMWKSIDDFLHMGGYGLYVWGSYAVTFVVMVFEGVMARRRMHAARTAAAKEHMA